MNKVQTKQQKSILHRLFAIKPKETSPHISEEKTHSDQEMRNTFLSKQKGFTPDYIKEFYIEHLVATQNIGFLMHSKLRNISIVYDTIKDCESSFESDLNKITLSKEINFDELDDIKVVLHKMEHAYVNFVHEKRGKEISGLQTERATYFASPQTNKFEITSLESCEKKPKEDNYDNKLGLSLIGEFLNEAMVEYSARKTYAEFLKKEFDKNLPMIKSKLSLMESPAELLPRRLFCYGKHTLTYSHSSYALNLHCAQMLANTIGHPIEELIEINRSSQNGFEQLELAYNNLNPSNNYAFHNLTCDFDELGYYDDIYSICDPRDKACETKINQLLSKVQKDMITQLVTGFKNKCICRCIFEERANKLINFATNDIIKAYMKNTVNEGIGKPYNRIIETEPYPHLA